MISKYFNQWEFNQASSLSKINPFEAKLKYEEYLKKYPKDYSTYLYYVSNLITLGELDKAEKILEYVKIISNKDSRFNNNLYKVKIFNNNFFYNKVRLLSYQEKYHELYHLYLNYLEKEDNIDINNIFFYCKKKIGKLNNDKIDVKTYLFKQIVEYDEKEFLKHIKKHLADYNKNSDNPNTSIFVPNFPIEKIIKEIHKYIPSNKRLFSGFIDDLYIFKYNECGRDNNKLVDYFKVFCFHNTSNFITMCPSLDCQELPYIDLNYLIPENKNIKIKRMSQIEKFNKKYNN